MYFHPNGYAVSDKNISLYHIKNISGRLLVNLLVRHKIVYIPELELKLKTRVGMNNIHNNFFVAFSLGHVVCGCSLNYYHQKSNQY